MALPVAPSPRSDDVAVLGWHGLTVRIAWTLLARGIKVRTEVLREARDHVLMHLDRHTGLPHAEDQAAVLTEAFIDRARGKLPTGQWPQDAGMPLSPRWRRAIERAFDPRAEVVFRKHYGDNRSLGRLARRMRVDPVALEAARGGLREVVRRAARADGVPIDDWPDERVDKVLVRLAAYAPGPCPPLLDVVEGGHREHVMSCTRCDRTLRLVRSSILTIQDLLPPSLGARPADRASLLMLQVREDAGRYLPPLVDELDVRAVRLGPDLLLLDAADIARVRETLVLAAQVESPGRDLLRGVFVEGAGRWCRHGLIGPLPERALQQLRGRPWGTVEAVGELPGPLPPAPRAWGAWSLVATIAASALLVGQVALRPITADDGITASFTAAREGVWTEFDVQESDLVSVVRAGDDGLEVILASHTPVDKASLATGDGWYRLHTAGTGVLVAASEHEIAGLDDIVAGIDPGPDALRLLAEEVAVAAPDARIRWFTP